MMTEEQTADLARRFGMDRFTVYREYLQLVFLSILYRMPGSERIYFKGGTAIHLFFHSPRFSEDLDFSTPDTVKHIVALAQKIEREIHGEFPRSSLHPLYQGKATVRFRLRCVLREFKYPFIIRLDFNRGPLLKPAVISPLVTEFPITFFPVVSHVSSEEIMAEKLRAIITRGKGRDFFDLWYLLEKGIAVDEKLVTKKLRDTGRKYSARGFERTVASHKNATLIRDLAQFLPRQQRKIVPRLKELLLVAWSKKTIA